MNEGLSRLKAARYSVTWWFPILEAVAHRAMGEIREGVAWVSVYLAKNVRWTKQMTLIQNRIFEKRFK
jgi:hypothetical protein